MKLFSGSAAYSDAGNNFGDGTVTRETATSPMKRTTTAASPCPSPMRMRPISLTFTSSLSVDVKSANWVTSRAEPSE